MLLLMIIYLWIVFSVLVAVPIVAIMNTPDYTVNLYPN